MNDFVATRDIIIEIFQWYVYWILSYVEFILWNSVLSNSEQNIDSFVGRFIFIWEDDIP